MNKTKLIIYFILMILYTLVLHFYNELGSLSVLLGYFIGGACALLFDYPKTNNNE